MTSIPIASQGVNTSASSAHESPRASLGIITSIVAAPDLVLRRLDAVSRRFSLQNTARSLLPDHRVAGCLRFASAPIVDVLHHPQFNSASFAGLLLCGSVHVCPVCASKIGARRADEITSGVTSWLDRGGSVLMATFTLQHNLTDSLSDIAGTLNQAYHDIRASRRWRAFADNFGLVGSITAREYTHGVSGWHPHLHALLFVKPISPKRAAELRDFLSDCWAYAVQRLGRYSHPEIGVNVRTARNGGLADYVSKIGKGWRVGDELAKANSKLGRKASRTPPQLLDAASYGDASSGRLFVEYADWTYRKNQIVWTPGLRKLLDLVEQEKTDEEIAEERTADGELISALYLHQWRLVLAHDARADLLNAAATGNLQTVVQMLCTIGVDMDLDLLAARSQFLGERL